jgi:predicted enzyme related to lactoylglutathione lyase
MKGNPVGWFEIYVKDMARARKFYETVFDVKLEALSTPESSVSEMWSFPMAREGSGAAGALVAMRNGGPSGNGTIVYFMSNDCATEAKRATANGGKVFKDKTSIGQHGFITLVEDTEGNLVGVHSMA